MFGERGEMIEQAIVTAEQQPLGLNPNCGPTHQVRSSGCHWRAAPAAVALWVCGARLTCAGWFDWDSPMPRLFLSRTSEVSASGVGPTALL
jgi:hypothetical protein